MRILLTQRPDGSAVLRCERPDGSVTWQTVRGANAAYFPLHDLTHFAVETELGVPNAFFGLLAAGWEITDTGGKGPRGALPPAAILVEHIVGMLDVERGSGHLLQADEFQQAIRDHVTRHPDWADAAEPALAPDALERIRQRRGALIREFRALPPGGTLELAFEAVEAP